MSILSKLNTMVLGSVLISSFIGCSASSSGNDDSVYTECYDTKRAEDKFFKFYEAVDGKEEFLKKMLNAKDLSTYMEIQSMISGFKFSCITDKTIQQYIANKASSDAILDDLVASAKKHPDEWSKFNAMSMTWGLMYAVKPRGERTKDLEKPCNDAVNSIFIAKLTHDFGIPFKVYSIKQNNEEFNFIDYYCESYSGSGGADSIFGHFDEITDLLTTGKINHKSH